MTSEEELYQRWLEQQRRERTGPELTDRVMAAVTRGYATRPVSRLMLVLLWMDRSRSMRFAACVGALLVGSMPLAYLAYISRAFVF